MQEQQPVSFALALAVVSFLLAVVWGRPLISELKRRGIGKKIHIEEPGVHQVKTARRRWAASCSWCRCFSSRLS